MCHPQLYGLIFVGQLCKESNSYNVMGNTANIGGIKCQRLVLSPFFFKSVLRDNQKPRSVPVTHKLKV